MTLAGRSLGPSKTAQRNTSLRWEPLGGGAPSSNRMRRPNLRARTASATWTVARCSERLDWSVDSLMRMLIQGIDGALIVHPQSATLRLVLRHAHFVEAPALRLAPAHHAFAL